MQQQKLKRICGICHFYFIQCTQKSLYLHSLNKFDFLLYIFRSKSKMYSCTLEKNIRPSKKTKNMKNVSAKVFTAALALIQCSILISGRNIPRSVPFEECYANTSILPSVNVPLFYPSVCEQTLPAIASNLPVMAREVSNFVFQCVCVSIQFCLANTKFGRYILYRN